LALRRRQDLRQILHRRDPSIEFGRMRGIERSFSRFDRGCIRFFAEDRGAELLLSFADAGPRSALLPLLLFARRKKIATNRSQAR